MFTPFNKISLKHPVLKSHSRLYSLSPVGVGTPMIECLTGYISRLAEAHNTTVGTLIGWEVAPLLKKKYLDTKVGGKILGGRMQEVVRSLDSTGQTAIEWSQLLEKLTLKSNLHLLTMRPLAKAVSTRNLLRHWRAWCFTCYEQWQRTKQVIYEPILWRLKAVNLCPHHGVPLQTQCNNCERDRLPILVAGTRPGYCSYCYQWLGLSSPKISPDNCGIEKMMIEQQVAIAKSIGEVLEVNARLKMKKKIAAAVLDCIMYFAKGSFLKFAELTKISVRMIRNWCSGMNIPRLDFLAQVCYAFNISIIHLLEGQFAANNNDKFIQSDTASLSRIPSTKKINFNQIRRELESLLQSETHPSSFSRVSQNLGYDRGFLQRHFPILCLAIRDRYNRLVKTNQEKLASGIKALLRENSPLSVAAIAVRLGKSKATLYQAHPQLCHELAERYKAHQKELRQGQKRAINEEVQRIALKLYACGVNPSQHNVAKLMSKPGQMSNEPARSALRAVQHELHSKK